MFLHMRLKFDIIWTRIGQVFRWRGVRKWTRRHEFKSWMRLIAFHIALIPLRKLWIELSSLQLWINSRANWVLQPWWGNQSRRRKMLYSRTHIHIHFISRDIINNNDDFNERTNTLLYKNIPLTPYSLKGCCFLCERGKLETGTDSYILTQSSSDHSSTSFSSWLGCSTVGHWGPKPSVWSWFSLRGNPISNCNSNSNSKWLKPSVAPGYIIVWRPPASCGRTHLHRIQPRPQVKVTLESTR